MDSRKLKLDIELAVRERNRTQAPPLIKRWLKGKEKSIPHLLQAADWFRRMGLLREAFAVLAPKEWNFSRARENENQTSQYLYLARILNLMGATRYALQVARAFKPTKAADLRYQGNIFLSDYDFKSAKICFEKAKKASTAEERKTYDFRIGSISLADSMAGLGEFKAALERIDEIPCSDEETYLQALKHQAKAETLALVGKFSLALGEIKRAECLLPPGDTSPDRGILLKWQGYIEGKLGKKKEASQLFKDALEILQLPEYRPEVWLEVYSSMKEVDLLGPENELTLFTYPDLPRAFRERKGMPKGVSLWNPKAKITLFPFRGEWLENGKPRLGLSITQNLLAYLLMAGREGIPVERIKPLLWPEEFSSFIQIGSRLEQLLNRLKKEFKVICKTERGGITFLNQYPEEFNVEVLPGSAPLRFYELHPVFKLEDFATYYDITSITAHRFLKAEIDRARLATKKEGRTLVYRFSITQTSCGSFPSE